MASQTDLSVCKFCNKGFKRETTLAAHLCEPKRRFQQRGEAGVKIGLMAYLLFYEYTQGTNGKKKTLDDFDKSPYYSAFVKFGNHCVGINAINVKRFVEWLIKNNKKLDYWHKDSMYDEFLHQYLRIEAVTDALQRAVEYSIKWSEETGMQPHDILRYGNTNSVCFAISTGRISPWVLFTCESGHAFLEKLNTDQTHIVLPWIEPDFWHKKLKDYPEDVEFAKTILKKAGW